MRPELEFNDPDTHRQRIERLSRLGSSEAEHTYLHATLDDAVAQLQGSPLLWLCVIWLAILSAAVLLLWL